jgi:HSP20 family molecular chaperone IbpA
MPSSRKRRLPAEEELSIEVKEDLLVREEERKVGAAVQESPYHRQECPCDPFRRAFGLPATPGPGKMKAEGALGRQLLHLLS